MNKKKICCITTIDATLESFVVEAMRQFTEKGYEVTMVCSNTNTLKKKYGDMFRYVDMPMKRGIKVKDLITMPWRFHRFFKREKFDMVQYATPNASLYASIGAWMADVAIRLYCQWGIRYVGMSGVMRKMFKTLEHLTCALSTDICSASQKNLEFAVSEGLYKADKAKIIGNGGTIGVDLTRFNLQKKAEFKEEILKKHPILRNKLIVCFVGRLNRDKGSFELLTAFERLSKEREDIALLLVGFRETAIPTYVSSITQNERVVFTGSTNEVYKYLAASDVYAHPSYREGFSMAIQEAMAMQVAIVTTDIPGPSEVIEGGVSGILVKPRDVESLYEGLKEMLNNSEERDKMAAAGRERCEKLFNRPRMLKLTYEHRMGLLNK